MFRYFLKRALNSTLDRYNYDYQYMEDILDADIKAFVKFLGFQTMASHSRHIPAEALYAARLRAVIWEDCGPCTQLIVDMALDAKVSEGTLHAIIKKDFTNLPEELTLVVEFTDYVLAHDPRANDLRAQIISRWGQKALVTLSYGISASRVYPTIKYVLGYGNTCHRIQLNDISLTPAHFTPSE